MSETPGADTFDPRAATTPIYRQSNIGLLQLVLSPEHWESPRLAGRWCVQPGDVVLNKLAPLRAALVPPAARRHPVDGNSIIVRGLSRPVATWLAICLNRNEYAQLLLIESGILRRVGLGALAALRLPPPPPELEMSSVVLRDLLDESILVGEELHRAAAEAARETAVSPSKVDLRSGSFVSGAVLSSDSWLPTWVAQRASQTELSGQYGWLPLGALALTSDRTRLKRCPDGARAVRLGDVGGDLLVRLDPSVEVSPLQPGRTLDQPLIGGEVLLSTLGSSPRTAYVDGAIPRRVFPTDSWVRLRFRETPAAWALLLSTPTICRQIGGLAVGSVQQFVPPEMLMSVYLPIIEPEVRERWQRTVERHHDRRRDLEHRWSLLNVSFMRIFDQVHGVMDSYGSGPGVESEVRR